MLALLTLLAAGIVAQSDEGAPADPEIPDAAAPTDDSSSDDTPAGDISTDDAFFDDPFAVGPETSGDTREDPFPDPFAVNEEPDSGADPRSGTVDGQASDFMDLDDLDALFSDEEIIDEAEESEKSASIDPSADLLTTEGVRWGGKVRGSVAADFIWDDVWTPDFALLDPTDESLEPSIGASLFFDARPEQEFRAFGKLEIATTTDGGLDLSGLSLLAGGLDTSALPEGWTSEENVDGDTEIRDETGTLIITIPAADNGGSDTTEVPPEDEGSVGTAPGLEISIFELFSDFVWKDKLFFRFGKHTIQWGTGYFFSPADVLNLTAVDAEDPTADREGPLSLRIHYPFGVTANAYLYTIVNSGAAPLDVAVAPKIEFAVGNGELGIGGYYQRTLAPRLIALYSASIGDIDLFAEGVGLYGSDRVFVRPSRDQSEADADPEDDLELVLDTYEIPNALFAQATVGLRYVRSWEDKLSLAVIGQYFFNGEGYAGDVPGLLPAAARLLANPGENGLVIDDAGAQPDGYEDPPALALGDLTNWGRHYLGATVSLSDIAGSNLGITAFGLVNMNDWSGIVTPALSYGFLERFSVSASARFTFGGEAGEFTNPAALFSGDPAEPTFGVTISLSMPGGSF